MSEVLKIGKSYTRALFASGSFNEKDNTVDVVFATESTAVTRYDWENRTDFVEVLVCQESAVRLSRINNGAPLLNSHDRYSLDGIIGVVVKGSARVEGGKCVATVRLSNREDVKSVIQDVKDGIINGVSVGYEVFTYERQPVVGNEVPTYRAIDWEPQEISFVPVPADPDSGIRSKQIEAQSVRVVTKSTENQPKNQNMDLKARALAVGLKEDATEAQVVAAERTAADLKARALAVGLKENATEAEIVAAERKKTTTPVPDPDEVSKRAAEAARAAIEADRVRAKSIRDLCTTHRLTESNPNFVNELIDKGVSLEDARAKVLDELAKADPKIRSISVTGRDEQDKERDAKIASLVIRSAQINNKEITKEERELSQKYRGYTLLDFARMALEDNGVDTRGMDKMEIAKRSFERASISSHTTDFPILLEGVNRRVLLASYTAAMDTWSQFCAIGSVSDFREWKRLRWGSLTRLDALGENSEYKNKKINDAEFEKVSAGTFGNTINISRQMIINDDLKAFTDLTKALGRAAARGIEIDVYSLLAQNSGAGPTMQDGKAMFHADHGNLLTSGAAPSVAEFDKMRVLMAKQKDKDQNDFLHILPAIWLGPVDLEGTAKVVNGSQYDPDAVNKLQLPNKVAGMFKNVVGTPRLSGTPYYSFADPADEPVIEVSFLDGNRTPYLESEMPFDIDGIRWKVRLDYGVGGVGYRGAVKNPGA